jgi:hypothetical protein
VKQKIKLNEGNSSHDQNNSFHGQNVKPNRTLTSPIIRKKMKLIHFTINKDMKETKIGKVLNVHRRGK